MPQNVKLHDEQEYYTNLMKYVDFAEGIGK